MCCKAAPGQPHTQETNRLDECLHDRQLARDNSKVQGRLLVLVGVVGVEAQAEQESDGLKVAWEGGIVHWQSDEFRRMVLWC